MSNEAEEYYQGNYRSKYNTMFKENRKIQQFNFDDMMGFAQSYADKQVEKPIELLEELLINENDSDNITMLSVYNRSRIMNYLNLLKKK